MNSEQVARNILVQLNKKMLSEALNARFFARTAFIASLLAAMPLCSHLTDAQEFDVLDIFFCVAIAFSAVFSAISWFFVSKDIRKIMERMK